MRDMLTNNCHITNLVKKIDYIQSICKQCKSSNCEDRRRRNLSDDNPESEFEELPGKDLSIEMINLKRTT